LQTTSATQTSQRNGRELVTLEYVDSNRPALGFVHAPNPIIVSPFELVLDPRTIRRVANRAVHRSESVKEVPNWSIRTSDGGYIVPDPHAQTDYLLVWRLPNWIESAPTASGDFNNVVTIFCGTHGVGTSAVRLLFDHLELLKRISYLVEKYKYWQALITINSLRLDTHPHSAQKRLVATSLSDRIEYGQLDFNLPKPI
jgi:hypothetical protein